MSSSINTPYACFNRYRDITYYPDQRKYGVTLRAANGRTMLGVFDTLDEAVAAQRANEATRRLQRNTNMDESRYAA